MKYKPINLKFLTMALTLAMLGACEPNEPDLPNNPLNGLTTAVFNPDKSYGTVTDIEGNVYKTIVIGTQTWMSENLRTTKYNNGDELPNVKDTTEWANLYTGAYCNYNNTNSLDTIATYGRLYNWYAVADERNLAPKGWRVANVIDWLELVDYLGGDSIAGGKLKEFGDMHWESPNRADNSSGFTVLSYGFRYKDGKYKGIGLYNSYWAFPGYNDSSAPFLYLFSWDIILYKGINYKVNGYSIRCIRE